MRATKPNLTPQEAEQLVDTYADLILRLSYTYLKNTQDAQDICQTVFLKFVEKPRTFRSPEHEKAWIIRAAVLAMTVTAGAAGALKPAAEAFSGLFGIVTPAQTEVIDHIGYLIGASDTDNGITVTADAIMADRYSYAVVYSVVRADGSPLFEGLDVYPGYTGPLPVQFDDWSLELPGFHGGAHGTCYFVDQDPTDPAIQFVDTMTLDAPLPQGTAKVRLAGLHRIEYDESNGEIRKADSIPGRWDLAFEFRTEDCSADLPAGQTFDLNGTEVTLESVVLSPLSLQVSYTVDGGRYDGALPLLVNLRNGTAVDMSNAGCAISPGEDRTFCQKGDVFETILPMEDVVSVTVGDIEIPVN